MKRNEKMPHTCSSTFLDFRLNLIFRSRCSTTGLNSFGQFSFNGVYRCGGTGIFLISALPPWNAKKGLKMYANHLCYYYISLNSFHIASIHCQCRSLCCPAKTGGRLHSCNWWVPRNGSSRSWRAATCNKSLLVISLTLFNLAMDLFSECWRNSESRCTHFGTFYELFVVDFFFFPN